ncbi:MAG: DUF3024 domain-containing protein [Flavobacterium sp.]|nr:DUF3024 domain-containing protein [Flavobacterium sp.]
MALQFENEIEIIEVMEGYLINARPPEEIRNEVDIAYKVENQSVIIFEIRPHWKNKSENIEVNVAKATFIKTEEIWKIFWYKSDDKWHNYDPKPKVKSLKQFVEVIREDKHNCFWG